MADDPLGTYLNDHMGGAMLGSELADQIRDRNEGTPLGGLMASIAAESWPAWCRAGRNPA